MTPSELASVIEQEWHPLSLKDEREYQSSLYEFLGNRLPKHSTIVQKNYPEAGMLVDVFVRMRALFGAWNVFVELKRDLTTTECDRLVGQIRRLGLKRYIIIILVGDVDPAVVGRLREEFALPISKGGVIDWQTMFIVEKLDSGSASTR